MTSPLLPPPLRNIHHRRIADLTLAYIRAKLSTEKSLLEAHDNFLKSMQTADKKFRDIIDQNCPLLYVIDCEEIANIVYDELKDTVQERKETLKDYSFTYKEGGKATKYFSRFEEYDNEGNIVDAVQNDSNEFYATFMKNVLNSTFKTTLTKALFTELNKSIPVSVNPTDLNTEVNKLYTDYTTEAAALSRVGSRYLNFTTLSVEFGLKFKQTVFKNARAVKLQDPKSVIPTINSNTIVVLADSFTYFRDTYNPKLTDALREVFKTRGAVYYESSAGSGGKSKVNFSIGEFVDIGHTAAFATGGQALGVNMPAAQAAFTDLDIYKGQELELALSQLYSDLDLQVTFDKNFSGLGTSFINFSVAIGTVMRKPINSTLLRTVENRVIAPFKTEVKAAVLRILSSQEYKDFIIASVPKAESSKTVIEFITAAIVEPLRNISVAKTLKNEVSKAIVNRKNIVKVAPVVKIGKAIKKPTKNAKVTTKTSITTTKPQINRRSDPDTKVLLSLQNLLNASLIQKVKQNMGGGSRRDILNLRSGRFADSVRVERLSESRGGAITAFYNYMRNPYATFSAGGRQEYPRSRDPKLLISKSIRELAQTITQQRLRAVLV